MRGIGADPLGPRGSGLKQTANTNKRLLDGIAFGRAQAGGRAARHASCVLDFAPEGFFGEMAD